MPVRTAKAYLTVLGEYMTSKSLTPPPPKGNGQFVCILFNNTDPWYPPNTFKTPLKQKHLGIFIGRNALWSTKAAVYVIEGTSSSSRLSSLVL